MVVSAGRIGLTGTQFWQLTPREFRHAVDAYTLRMQDALDRDVALAWRGAAFYAMAFAGKLPSLEKVLARRPSVAVGEVNQDALVASWSQFIGTKARPISDAAKQALGLTKES